MFYPIVKKLAIFGLVFGLTCAVSTGAMAADEAKPDTKKDEAKNHYIKIPPLLLPIMGDNGVEQIVSIVVSIETPSDDAAKNVDNVIPRLNDAFVTELYGTLDRRERMKNGVLDIVFIKQKLVAIADKIAGQDNIKDILIQGVAQHQS